MNQNLLNTYLLRLLEKALLIYQKRMTDVEYQAPFDRSGVIPGTTKEVTEQLLSSLMIPAPTTLTLVLDIYNDLGESISVSYPIDPNILPYLRVGHIVFFLVELLKNTSVVVDSNGQQYLKKVGDVIVNNNNILAKPQATSFSTETKIYRFKMSPTTQDNDLQHMKKEEIQKFFVSVYNKTYNFNQSVMLTLQNFPKIGKFTIYNAIMLIDAYKNNMVDYFMEEYENNKKLNLTVDYSLIGEGNELNFGEYKLVFGKRISSPKQAAVYLGKRNGTKVIIRVGGEFETFIHRSLYPYITIYDSMIKSTLPVKGGLVINGVKVSGRPKFIMIMEPLEEIVWNDKIFYQAMKFLIMMMDHNIKHNDISPSNIMMSKLGDLKVIDFSQSNRITRNFSSCGGDMCAMSRSLLVHRYQKELEMQVREYYQYILENIHILERGRTMYPFFYTSRYDEELWIKLKIKLKNENIDISSISGISNIHRHIALMNIYWAIKMIKDYEQQSGYTDEMMKQLDVQDKSLYEKEIDKFNRYSDEYFGTNDYMQFNIRSFMLTIRQMIEQGKNKEDFIVSILIDMSLGGYYMNTNSYLNKIKDGKYGNVKLSQQDLDYLKQYLGL